MLLMHILVLLASDSYDALEIDLRWTYDFHSALEPG